MEQDMVANDWNYLQVELPTTGRLSLFTSDGVSKTQKIFLLRIVLRLLISFLLVWVGACVCASDSGKECKNE
jgi:hypothetical protein